MTNDPIDKKEAGMDLYQLIKQDGEAQARIQSYGLDPVRIEEWMLERAPSHADPTAATAIYNADRDLAKRRKTKR